MYFLSLAPRIILKSLAQLHAISTMNMWSQQKSLTVAVNSSDDCAIVS